VFTLCGAVVSTPARDFDVAVVGSGFAGALLARLLARHGRSVVLVERGHHPRFALGESSTPLAAIALERLARRHGLAELGDFGSWGRWQARQPELRCGLKRGFTFYGHRRGEPYSNSGRDERRLLVAASPTDAVADVHWRRADVDARFVRRAVEDGATLLEGTAILEVEPAGDGVRLAARSETEALDLRARFVVDASGPAAVVARALGAVERRAVDSGPALVYGHFAGVEPFDRAAASQSARFESPPYPEGCAAVHHLLENGWIYVLPFDDGVVSAGVLRRDLLANGREDLPADLLWRAALSEAPSLAQAFRGARAVVGPQVARGIRRRLDRAAGERWAALPHVYAFNDPLFSTGIAWSLVAVERLTELLLDADSRALEPERLAPGLARYRELLSTEADHLEALVVGAERLYGDFDRFVSWSLLYFATASFCEARQRLVDPPAAGWEGFLGADDALLAGVFERAGRRLDEEGDPNRFATWVRETIVERDIGGFAEAGDGRRIGVDLAALVERAGRLGLSQREVRAALRRLRGGIF
jgi:FADH2 O2-dependent halogenase